MALAIDSGLTATIAASLITFSWGNISGGIGPYTCQLFRYDTPLESGTSGLGTSIGAAQGSGAVQTYTPADNHLRWYRLRVTDSTPITPLVMDVNATGAFTVNGVVTAERLMAVAAPMPTLPKPSLIASMASDGASNGGDSITTQGSVGGRQAENHMKLCSPGSVTIAHVDHGHSGSGSANWLPSASGGTGTADASWTDGVESGSLNNYAQWIAETGTKKTLAIGTNDLVGLLTPASAAANVATTVAAVVAAGNTVLLYPMTYRFDGNQTVYQRMVDYAALLEAMDNGTTIRCIAGSFQRTWAYSANQGLFYGIGSDRWYGDSIHPTYGSLSWGSTELTALRADDYINVFYHGLQAAAPTYATKLTADFTAFAGATTATASNVQGDATHGGGAGTFDLTGGIWTVTGAAGNLAGSGTNLPLNGLYGLDDMQDSQVCVYPHGSTQSHAAIGRINTASGGSGISALYFSNNYYLWVDHQGAQVATPVNGTSIATNANGFINVTKFLQGADANHIIVYSSLYETGHFDAVNGLGGRHGLSFATLIDITAYADLKGAHRSGLSGYTSPAIDKLIIQQVVTEPIPTITQAGTTITLASADGSATIRYTTNGVDPTSSTGTVYTVPFTALTGTDVRAIGVNGVSVSGVAQLTIIALPGAVSTLTAAPISPNTNRITRGTATGATAYSLYDNGALVTAAMGTTYDIADSNLALPNTYAVKGTNAAGSGPLLSLSIGGSSGSGSGSRSHRVGGNRPPVLRY